MARVGLLSVILICGIAQQAMGWQLLPKFTNQETAELIASELRKADLKGTDITIEFRAGGATLEGFVADSAQKQKAGKVTSRTPGVEETVNSLRVRRKGSDGATHDETENLQSLPKQGDDSRLKSTNQEIAESIASALGAAGLNGYNLQITYQDGTATLAGAVANSQQQILAGKITSQISGVEKIVNSLKVNADENPLAFSIIREVGNSIPPPAAEVPQEPPVPDDEDPVSEELQPLLLSIPPSMMGQFLLGKQMMARQQELFESETLHKIEVSTLHKDKSTPLYDIYCGRKQLVVVSRCGGFHSASFEGRFDNSFQGGVYEWKSGEKTGMQYNCDEQDLLQLFRYSTDVGGFMTGLYMQTRTHPEFFQKPIERENGVKEFRLKTPRDNLFAIAVYEDPRWICELTTLNANREEVKRVYSRPSEVDQIPEEITRELKEVTFEPTKRTIHSLMVYP